jgi:hypothetical protein
MYCKKDTGMQDSTEEANTPEIVGKKINIILEAHKCCGSETGPSKEA